MNQYAPTTVRYSRLPSQGIVYGFDMLSFMGLFIAALILGLSVMSNGIWGLLTSFPIYAPVGFLAVKKRHGQSYLTHVGRELGGVTRMLLGATKFKARPEREKLTAVNAIDLPGREGRLFIYETGRGASVIWDAVKQTATITCVVATPGLGQPQMDAPSTLNVHQREWAIHEWAKVLGSFTQKEHIVRVTELETTRNHGRSI